MDTPFLLFFITIDRGGIWFPYKGDEVLWTWPWTRRERKGDNRRKAPFISVGMSGNGEWGDARYWTLKELNRDWDEYFTACEKASKRVDEEPEWPKEYECVWTEEEMQAMEDRDIASGQPHPTERDKTL